VLYLKIHVYNLPAPVDKSKTAKEEARELLLKEEASVREKVGYVQKNLALMLDALGELAIANPVFTHGQLPHLVSNPTLALSSFLFVLPCNIVFHFLMCFTTIPSMADKIPQCTRDTSVHLLCCICLKTRRVAKKLLITLYY
jgi:hypothetical protein